MIVLQNNLDIDYMNRSSPGITNYHCHRISRKKFEIEIDVCLVHKHDSFSCSTTMGSEQANAEELLSIVEPNAKRRKLLDAADADHAGSGGGSSSSAMAIFSPADAQQEEPPGNEPLADTTTFPAHLFQHFYSRVAEYIQHDGDLLVWASTCKGAREEVEPERKKRVQRHLDRFLFEGFSSVWETNVDQNGRPGAR